MRNKFKLASFLRNFIKSSSLVCVLDKLISILSCLQLVLVIELLLSGSDLALDSLKSNVPCLTLILKNFLSTRNLNLIWNVIHQFSSDGLAYDLKYSFNGKSQTIAFEFGNERKFLNKGKYSICARSVPIEILQFGFTLNLLSIITDIGFFLATVAAIFCIIRLGDD